MRAYCAVVRREGVAWAGWDGTSSRALCNGCRCHRQRRTSPPLLGDHLTLPTAAACACPRFATDGMLLREAMTDPLLEKYR